MVAVFLYSIRQELTVGVGERPDYLEQGEQEEQDSEQRAGNGKRRGRRRPNGRRRAADDRSLATTEETNGGGVAVDRELAERRGERPERRSSRERALTRLLAG